MSLYHRVNMGQSPEDYGNPSDVQDSGLPPGADPCDPNNDYYDEQLCEDLMASGEYQPPQEYAPSPGDQGQGYPQAPQAPSAPSPGGAPGGGPSAGPSDMSQPMAPPYGAPPAGNATSPSGGTYSTTPTPYTDASGQPTDAMGNPSDAYGNPLNAQGQPTDSNGQPLPTDANGNAAPPTGDQSQANNAAPAPTGPSVAPGVCDSMVFPVPADRIPTGEVSSAAQASLQRSMLYDQQGPVGTVGIVPMPNVPSAQTPPYAIVSLNTLVQDPASGLLSYLAFADLSGVANRIYAQSWGVDSDKYQHDQPGIADAIRAACPQFMDLQDLILSGMVPTYDSGRATDLSSAQIPGWTWQQVDAQGNVVEDSGDPCDSTSSAYDPNACAASGMTPYSATIKAPAMHGWTVIGYDEVGAPIARRTVTSSKAALSKGTRKAAPSKKAKRKMPALVAGVKKPEGLRGYLRKTTAADKLAAKKKAQTKAASAATASTMAKGAAAARAAQIAARQAAFARKKAGQGVSRPGYQPTVQQPFVRQGRASVPTMRQATSLRAGTQAVASRGRR